MYSVQGDRLVPCYYTCMCSIKKMKVSKPVFFIMVESKAQCFVKITIDRLVFNVNFSQNYY